MTKPIAITILDNGPLKISSKEMSVRYCGKPVPVEEGKDVYICRCGESKMLRFATVGTQKLGLRELRK